MIENHRLVFVWIASMICLLCESDNKGRDTAPFENPGKIEYPGEWMYNQRAFPDAQIDHKAYELAIIQAMTAKETRHRSHAGAWELAGPINVGGRITDIALHPTNQNVMYVSSSNGGVFKTEDGGVTWQHVYLNEGRLSIGNIALAPSDPDVVYIGTGEANASATSGAFFGDGLYRSDDGGQTWQPLGLAESHHIGRIVVHPEDPNLVYVAATGHLYGKNDTRGIFRSGDGGLQWEQVLFVSDSTSAIDIAIDPAHPDTLYAAFWERLRYPHRRDYAGPTSGIYRSIDGGDNWIRLANGLPSHNDVGRIGLTVSPSVPGLVYATFAENQITNDFAGLYRSTDAGLSWVKIDDSTLEDVQIYAGFGWYFGNVRVDPLNPDKVYVLGLTTWKSDDGGVSWTETTFFDVHVDHHALEIHPQNNNLLVLGTDGGVYISRDKGATWLHIKTLPVTEFYTCEIDEQQPIRYYGGSQDNGTLRTRTGHTDDWERIFGGDGFYVIVDPVDTNIIYCEYQYGNLFKSYDGGWNWEYSLFGIDGADRMNWNTPVIMSPHNRQRLYYGTHRLYTSANGAQSWEVISDDLTNQDPGSPGGAAFGSLTTIAVAVSDSNVIYTGSEDGYVYVTFNHGGQWHRISDALPVRYVTRVAVDPYDALTAYVTISGYKSLDYLSHIFRTTNGGSTWKDISGDLPEVPLNDIIVDPEIPSTLYVASDLGIWVTEDRGTTWSHLGEGLPMTSYNDLEYHPATRQLVAASFGLSMWKYQLEEPPVSASQVVKGIDRDIRLYPNPVSEHGLIEFSLLQGDEILIALHDIHGRYIKTLFRERLESKTHRIQWSASGIPAGAYVIRITGARVNISRVTVVLSEEFKQD